MNRFLLRLILLWALMLTAGCLGKRPYHSTPIDALTEFPGYLDKTIIGSVELLQSENVAGGRALLYRFPRYTPTAAPVESCLATTFVTQERNGGWRSQSASRLGCYQEQFEADQFTAMYTVGGNITDLTTVYGFSKTGHQVSIEWADGLVEVVPLNDNTFLKSRPENLRVDRATLLDRSNNALETIDWSETEVAP